MQVLALQLDVQLHDQPSDRQGQRARTEQQPGLLMLCGEGPGASDDRDPGWAGSHNTPKRGPKGVQGGCVLPTEPGQESRPAELNRKHNKDQSRSALILGSSVSLTPGSGSLLF